METKMKKKINFAVIGETDVGKSTLIGAFKGERDIMKHTQVMDFRLLTYKETEITFTDYSGVKDHIQLVREQILTAASVGIAFDLSKSDPTASLIEFYNLTNPARQKVIFIGCKCDLEQPMPDEDILYKIRQITQKEETHYYKTSGTQFVGTSELLESWHTITLPYQKVKENLFAEPSDQQQAKSALEEGPGSDKKSGLCPCCFLQ